MKTAFSAMLITAGLLLAMHWGKAHLPQPERLPPGGTLMCEKDPDWLTRRTEPFYILPHIEYAGAVRPQMADWMQMMEPGGPQGKIQLGHTMGVMPLSLYTRPGGVWKYKSESLDKELKWAAEQKRPFVIYILSNHFAAEGMALVDELKKDPQNLMSLRSGAAKDEEYFHTSLVPFTLSSNPDVPVNHYKNLALREIAKALRKFDAEHPGLLLGVEMNGETHYLFPDFFNGTGNFTTPELMDYSDLALAEFAAYLKESGVEDDAERIRQIDFRHYDAGWLPISGWLDEPTGFAPVEIYVDGQKLGEAERPINRLDVFENPDAKVTQPNTGFSYMLDVSTLAPGRHVVQAIVTRQGRRMEIGARDIVLGEARGDTPARLKAGPLGGGWRGWLDHPGNNAEVRYDPLARHWTLFRAHQIERHVQAMADIFRAAGFSNDRLYSYQIAPWMFGGWNEQLFGVGREFFRMKGLVPGINLYGGNFINPSVMDSLDTSQGYAIPETHPQMKGAPDLIEKGLRYHYCNGAKFMGPYFVMLTPKKKYNAHARFRLSADNPEWGSDDFFRLLQEMIRQ